MIGFYEGMHTTDFCQAAVYFLAKQSMCISYTLYYDRIFMKKSDQKKKKKKQERKKKIFTKTAL